MKVYVACALSARLVSPPGDVKQAVLDFFSGRLDNMLSPLFGADVVAAALSSGIDDLVQAVARVKALHEFRQRADFEALATAVKRVQNIVKEPERYSVSTRLPGIGKVRCYQIPPAIFELDL